MSDRRSVSSSLSAQIVHYLRKRGHKQAEIARMLGVSEGFVSLVKSKERSLTLDHLGLLCEAMSVPLGAFLLAVTEPPKGTKDVKKLFSLSAQIMKKADDAHQAIMRSPVTSPR